MKVLIVEPGKYPREADIEHTLKAEQAGDAEIVIHVLSSLNTVNIFNLYYYKNLKL